ncbi:unnamed protein product [Hydatigera taeniaeformis]|uniref:DUF5742 domain-containing protein n=1 Tax=Hydatigena taeniaeformis TaxID=6205 RepID=A0A0R3WI72_HYDTA|nr:unnamed protein product [Hydatigera taeniaeformis]
MVRPNVGVSRDVVKFCKSLQARGCSAKWDWAKVLEVLQSDGQCGNAFLRVCEAGVYHMMYCRPVGKNTTMCKKLHPLDVRMLEYVGACFSRLMLAGTVSNRVDKFGVLLQQVISTLLDAAISAFKLSGFNSSALEPLLSLRDPKSELLPHLLPMDNIDFSNKLGLALCRMHILSSILRSTFECGSTTVLPVCLPYMCFAFCAIFSTNICDSRYSSSPLIICAKHLLHSFCVVVRSCGINISPGAPPLVTCLIYQLEWSSQFAQSRPSKDSLTYKLAVYRCLSSILDVTGQAPSSSLIRLTSRIISSVCFDISLAAGGSLFQSLTPSTEDLSNYELHVCCVAASIRLIELLFVNHSFILMHSLGRINNHPFRQDNGFSDYKIKQALLSLSSELHKLAVRLVNLLNKPNNLTPLEQVLVKPHFLIPFLNAASAVQGYGFLFSKSNALHELSKVLLRHDDPLVRINAERYHRYTFVNPAPLTLTKSNLCDGSSVSSFTQTEQSFGPFALIQEEKDHVTPFEVTQEQAQQIHEPGVANTTSKPSNYVSIARAETTSENTCEIPFQETDRPLTPPKESSLVETLAVSKGGKRRVSSDDSPPISAKKATQDIATQRSNQETVSLPESCSKKLNTPEEGSPSIQDVLYTFDDTLI